MSKIIQLYRDNAGRAKQPVNLVRNESEATIYIYDVIDAYWGISAKGVVDALTQAAGATTLHIRINSPGGDVMESRAIIEAIKRFSGKTIAHIDGLAASAATSVALAAEEVDISDGGFFMIHNASGMVWGDKTDMRETADLLEKVEGVIVAEYAAETGQEPAKIIEWMDAETWFTAQEAIDAGFVDRLAPTAAKAKNTWNLSAFAKAPAALAAPPPVENAAPAPEPVIAPVPAPAPEPEAAPVNIIPEPSMAQANKNRLALALAL
jgi:ATP-dependent Clp protease protease subunit